jgi:hypothetical protein
VPLTRATITVASQRMLPTYPVLATIVGLTFVLTPSADLRHNAEAFVYIDAGIGLHLWGWGFLFAAALMTIALVVRQRVLYQAVLAVFIVWLVLFAGVLAVAAMHEAASWSAWAWPAFGARACWASFLSLDSRET